MRKAARKASGNLAANAGGGAEGCAGATETRARAAETRTGTAETRSAESGFAKACEGGRTQAGTATG